MCTSTVETKVCTKCGTEKERNPSNFVRDKSRKDGFSPWCKECSRKNSKNHYENNKDVYTQKYLRIKDDPLCYRAILDRNIKWNKNNRESVNKSANVRYKKNPEKFREAKRRSDRKHPLTVKRNTAARRARLKNATPTWCLNNRQFNKDVENMFLMAGVLIHRTGEPWELEHIVPLTAKTKVGRIDVACGLHTIANLTLETKHLNDVKGSYFWPEMWDYSSKDERKALKEMYDSISN